MSVSLETLIAFADGELPEGERAAVQREIEANPALRAQLEAQRELRTRLSAAFDPVADQPPPARLVAAVRTPANVASLLARRPSWKASEWSAMAASLAAGLILGVVMLRPQAIVSTDHATFAAAGSLSRALDTQLASDAGKPVRIGLTYRDTTGVYCRTFAMESAQMQGLACRDNGRWQLRIVTHNASSSTHEMQTAGTDIDPTILQAAQSSMSASVFGADAERTARDAHWR